MIVNKTRQLTILISCAFFVLSAGISCNPEEICLEDTRTLVNIEFYQIVNGVEKDTALQGLFIRGRNERDSLLYDSALNIRAVSIPLSPVDDHADFIFTFTLQKSIWVLDSISVIDTIGTRLEADTVFVQDTFYIDFIRVPDTIRVDSLFKLPGLEFHSATDTVHFFYERELQLISSECGFAHKFNISDVFTTENVITGLSVIEPEIEISDEAHIKIFF